MPVSKFLWRTAIAPVALAALALAGCDRADDLDVKAEYPSDQPPYAADPDDRLFGRDGLVLFGGPDYEAAEAARAAAGGLGVNAWLWRATLDTLSFMPLSSADPFGGVVITDWYAPPQAPGERFKATAYILERALRADGVRVSVFRQVAGEGGAWRDAPVGESVATQLENTILTRARQLKIRAAPIDG